jgi:hypothetical protein
VQVRGEDGASNGAYIGAVKGNHYELDAIGVVGNGSYVSSSLAEVFFKNLGGETRMAVYEPAGMPLEATGPLFDDKWPDRGFELDKLLPRPILGVRILDRHVLAVAVEVEGGTWKAFIGASRGKDYLAEVSEIVKTGTPISYEVAETCFEDLSKGTKWHEPLRVCIAGEDYGPAEEWGGGKPAVPVRPGGDSKDDGPK